MTTPGRLLVLGRADFDALLRPPMVAEIEPADARALLADGRARWLDCRSPAEHAQSRLPGAQLVPLDELRHDAVYGVDPEISHIVYCRNGRRSRAAVFLLHERGFRARALRGGLAGWPFEIDAEPR
jgi:adenylyltransferase/sulfurtransferase